MKITVQNNAKVWFDQDKKSFFFQEDNEKLLCNLIINKNYISLKNETDKEIRGFYFNTTDLNIEIDSEYIYIKNKEFILQIKIDFEGLVFDQLHNNSNKDLYEELGYVYYEEFYE